MKPSLDVSIVRTLFGIQFYFDSAYVQRELSME